MESELKIGDEGKTDSGFWPAYRIVAAHSDGRLICELMSASGVPHLCTIKHRGMAAGIKLLPPTPRVLTLRNALMVDVDAHTLLSLQCVFDSPAARLADIIYQPDGRMVSITFADEATEPRNQPCELCGEIWERVRKVSDAASWNDLREAVDDVVGLLNDCGYGGDNA